MKARISIIRSAVIVACGMAVGCDGGTDPSPPLAEIAYTRFAVRTEVYLVDIDDETPIRISGEQRDGRSPTWSPDGERVAWTRQIGGGFYEIVIGNADGGEGTAIPGGSNAFSPAWSPDGSRIAFVGSLSSGPPSNFHIFVIPAGGGTAVRLTTVGSYNLDPAWSPDGTRIAFGSDRAPGGLFVMNADGTNVVSVPTGSAEGLWPTWSPDGRTIAFTGVANGDLEIFSVNVDGSELKRLTNNAGADYDPAWSPDGTLIAYASQRPGEGTQIYVMRPDGLQQRRVTPIDLQVAFEPAWRPPRPSK